MPLLVKNGCLFIATKVKGVSHYIKPYSFNCMTLNNVIETADNRESIQSLLHDLKLHPDINKKIFVKDINTVLLKKDDLIYQIGYIENKTYYGIEYKDILNNRPYSVISYTITGKANTPNVGINLEIQIYGNNKDVIERIMAQNTIQIQS